MSTIHFPSLPTTSPTYYSSTRSRAHSTPPLASRVSVPSPAPISPTKTSRTPERIAADGYSLGRTTNRRHSSQSREPQRPHTPRSYAAATSRTDLSKNMKDLVRRRTIPTTPSSPSSSKTTIGSDSLHGPKQVNTEEVIIYSTPQRQRPTPPVIQKPVFGGRARSETVPRGSASPLSRRALTEKDVNSAPMARTKSDPEVNDSVEDADEDDWDNKSESEVAALLRGIYERHGIGRPRAADQGSASVSSASVGKENSAHSAKGSSNAFSASQKPPIRTALTRPAPPVPSPVSTSSSSSSIASTSSSVSSSSTAHTSPSSSAQPPSSASSPSPCRPPGVACPLPLLVKNPFAIYVPKRPSLLSPRAELYHNTVRRFRAIMSGKVVSEASASSMDDDESDEDEDDEDAEQKGGDVRYPWEMAARRCERIWEYHGLTKSALDAKRGFWSEKWEEALWKKRDPRFAAAAANGRSSAGKEDVKKEKKYCKDIFPRMGNLRDLHPTPPSRSPSPPLTPNCELTFPSLSPLPSSKSMLSSKPRKTVHPSIELDWHFRSTPLANIHRSLFFFDLEQRLDALRFLDNDSASWCSSDEEEECRTPEDDESCVIALDGLHRSAERPWETEWDIRWQVFAAINEGLEKGTRVWNGRISPDGSGSSSEEEDGVWNAVIGISTRQKNLRVRRG
ncbi:hypothetical protein SISSUDRAFT_1127396 [Sistotremastrum suecicum HHB10207 ss-3]|uniref:Uncharacterized protein n=1 Tax=Sistotremastrum suecicum HHB10207 ss-3 TaxID=1314776 RepID=A0A166F3I8_9AGAM|nr:hypothetical protein SISSUDRAFT_1127396 [Sistotremastrum suecicum HHB10207 ss-3]